MARRPLFQRLPHIWKNLDRPQDWWLHAEDVQPGILERFLRVADSELDRVHELVAKLFELRSIDRVEDKYLPLIGAIVGHRWRDTQSYAWNRRRIRSAIHRWSYKRTIANIGDIIYDNGGGDWSVVDMASKLIVLSGIGHLSTEDCYFEGADYLAGGAYVLSVTDAVDLTGLRSDLSEATSAGERWYINIALRELAAFEMAIVAQLTSALRSTNADEYNLDIGALSDDLWLTESQTTTAVFHFYRLDIQSTGQMGGEVWVDSPWTVDLSDIEIGVGLPVPLRFQQPSSNIT